MNNTVNAERVRVAGELANSDRPVVYWSKETLGRMALKYRGVVSPSGFERCYELNHLGGIQPDGASRATRYIFMEDGTLLGVVSSRIEVDEDGDNLPEVESSMIFQTCNGLTVPNEDDNLLLDVLLRTGRNNSTLSERLEDE